VLAPVRADGGHLEPHGALARRGLEGCAGVESLRGAVATRL